MIVLSVIAALVTILAGTFAVIIRQMAVAHRDRYLEEVALAEFACADQPSRALRQTNAKPRIANQRRKPTKRPASGRGHSALLLH